MPSFGKSFRAHGGAEGLDGHGCQHQRPGQPAQRAGSVVQFWLGSVISRPAHTHVAFGVHGLPSQTSMGIGEPLSPRIAAAPPAKMRHLSGESLEQRAVRGPAVRPSGANLCAAKPVLTVPSPVLHTELGQLARV